MLGRPEGAFHANLCSSTRKPPQLSWWMFVPENMAGVGGPAISHTVMLTFEAVCPRVLTPCGTLVLSAWLSIPLILKWNSNGRI